jgi:hypothetical protein
MTFFSYFLTGQCQFSHFFFLLFFFSNFEIQNLKFEFFFSSHLSQLVSDFIFFILYFFLNLLKKKKKILGSGSGQVNHGLNRGSEIWVELTW